MLIPILSTRHPAAGAVEIPEKRAKPGCFFQPPPGNLWPIEAATRGRVFMRNALPVINLKEATYECIFGRGCDGICCQNGRPAVYAEEAARLGENLEKFLPHLRA